MLLRESRFGMERTSVQEFDNARQKESSTGFRSEKVD
jgi:hypothetical protein